MYEITVRNLDKTGYNSFEKLVILANPSAVEDWEYIFRSILAAASFCEETIDGLISNLHDEVKPNGR